jgi:AraC family transcriptional activator FtrA
VISKAPQLDKLIVPGREAKNLAADDVKQWNENGSTKPSKKTFSPLNIR